MKTTQKDIARKANVSQATVSRVLAGDQHVAAELRSHVERILEAENYFVNSRARSLRKKTSGQIGLVLKRSARTLDDDPFIAVLISSITQALLGSHYLLCVELAATGEEQGRIYENMLRTHRVDGVILLEPEFQDRRFTHLLEERFPFVVIGDPGEVAVCSVDNDNVAAGHLATMHLVLAGCRRVGMLAGPAGVRFSEGRIRGYEEAVRGARLEPLVWHSDFGLRSARRTASRLLAEVKDLDGLVALDDGMALAAAGAAQHRGLAVPDDVALVGFNNSGLCDVIDGGLTSVDLNIDQVIRAATEDLLDILNGAEPGRRRKIVPCSLVQRGSSWWSQEERAG